MSFISKSGADFLEESNAVRYLKGDHKCEKIRATSWIERNGIPESAKDLSCYSVKTPYSPNAKFFLNLPDAIDIAEGTRDCIIYHYVEKRRELVDLTTDDRLEADMIANFMKYESDDDGNWLIDTDYESYVISHAHLDADEQWSSSWDWLMPVVRNICTNNVGHEYRLTDKQIHLLENIVDIVCYGQIDDVYKAVINFIKNCDEGDV